MAETHDVAPEKDIAISIHPEFPTKQLGSYMWKARAKEFDLLVDSSGCELVESVRVNVRKIASSTLLGSGKVEDIRLKVEEHEAKVVFVDHPLTPVQQGKLEDALGAKVVDRTGLILEIFASRARTREGILQVELASLNYQMGRLVRSWTHLERQRGGVGLMGGPGERQIELDRRMIRDKVISLEKDLDKIKRMRATQRAGRQKKDMPTIALVGYTNAGKSTLFNRLTNAGVYVADQLFATLDPTLRLLDMGDSLRLMLSDTVGFVQDLPHELVNAFKATLEEVIEADLILHVRDASDPMQAEHAKVVLETLEQLGLVGDYSPPIIDVLNKKDMAPELQSFRAEGIGGSRVAISALTGEGMDELLALLTEFLCLDMHELHLKLELSDGRALAYCHQHGSVLRKDSDEHMMHIVVRMNPLEAARFTVDEAGTHRLIR